MPTDQDLFSTETAGLNQVSRPQWVHLAEACLALAYNGSIPGPALRVPQGAEISVDVRNDGDVETTVHWHRLRLENRFPVARRAEPVR